MTRHSTTNDNGRQLQQLDRGLLPGTAASPARPIPAQPLGLDGGPMFDPLLTVDQVSAWLGKPKATLYAWRTRKRGPRGIRVGGDLRYRRSEIEAWRRDDRSASILRPTLRESMAAAQARRTTHMGRPRIPLGCHGEIHYRTLETGAVQARTRIRDPDGVARQLTASATSKVAARNALLEDIQERLDNWAGRGSLITSDSTVEELAVEWSAEVEMKNLATGTLRVYRSTLDLYVLRYMGGWTLREVTTGRVDRVLKQHMAKGLRPETLRKVLHQRLALAVRHDAMSANPVTNVARVRSRREPVRTLENASQVSDIRALVQAWEARDRPGPKPGRDMRDLVTLLIATGMRIGEVLALRWSEVNLAAEQPYLLVTGTIKQEKGMGIYRKDAPKTPGSIRRLELPPTAVATLMDRQLHQGANPNDAVFPSRVGTWQSVSGVERRWRSITDKTPYAWVNFKTFRKTVATRIAEHLDSKAAARQLGHASDAITETYYIPRSETGPQVAGLLDEVLRSSEPRT